MSSLYFSQPKPSLRARCSYGPLRKHLKKFRGSKRKFEYQLVRWGVAPRREEPKMARFSNKYGQPYRLPRSWGSAIVVGGVGVLCIVGAVASGANHGLFQSSAHAATVVTPTTSGTASTSPPTTSGPSPLVSKGSSETSEERASTNAPSEPSTAPISEAPATSPATTAPTTPVVVHHDDGESSDGNYTGAPSQDSESSDGGN